MSADRFRGVLVLILLGVAAFLLARPTDPIKRFEFITQGASKWYVLDTKTGQVWTSDQPEFLSMRNKLE